MHELLQLELSGYIVGAVTTRVLCGLGIKGILYPLLVGYNNGAIAQITLTVMSKVMCPLQIFSTFSQCRVHFLIISK